jgi:hypothetical protein
MSCAPASPLLRTPRDAVYYNTACAHAALGDPDSGLKALEAALKEGYCSPQLYGIGGASEQHARLMRDAGLAKLAEDPRFQPLVGKYKVTATEMQIQVHCVLPHLLISRLHAPVPRLLLSRLHAPVPRLLLYPLTRTRSPPPYFPLTRTRSPPPYFPLTRTRLPLHALLGIEGENCRSPR